MKDIIIIFYLVCKLLIANSSLVRLDDTHCPGGNVTYKCCSPKYFIWHLSISSITKNIAFANPMQFDSKFQVIKSVNFTVYILSNNNVSITSTLTFVANPTLHGAMEIKCDNVSQYFYIKGKHIANAFI